MASAIQQLIAQQQGPNVLGAIGGAAQTMAALQQTKLAPLQYQQEQQRLDMGKAQLAQLGQQQEQQKRTQLLQLGANTALAIEKAPPEQRPQIYAEARNQAGRMGYDINQLPAEYGDEAMRVLDWSKQQIYGGEQFKTNEAIREKMSSPGRFKMEATPEGYAVYDTASSDKPAIYTDPTKAAKALADLENTRATTAKTQAEISGIPLTQEKTRAEIDKTNAETLKTKQEAAGGGKMTDLEKSAAGYYNRMSEAEQRLAGITQKGYNPISSGQALTGLSNVTASPEKQTYNQAANDWIRAKLRKESGAVIGAQEMKDEYKTYFPVYGDSDAVIAQKAEARKTAMEAMRGAGSAGNVATKEPAATTFNEGQTATNPQTGERIIYRSGQWQKM